MNNTNTYFSDDERSHNSLSDNGSDFENIDSDDSMDEETRRIVFKRTDAPDFKSMVSNPQPKITKTKSCKQPKTISLKNFNDKILQEEKVNQPKKFISKRAEDKKKSLGFDNSRPKRHFNPRLPPFTTLSKKDDIKLINTNNIKEFPTL